MIDFEAHLITKHAVYPSEFSAVRVVNYTPVATFHCFMRGKEKLTEDVLASNYQQVLYIEQLTGIPQPLSDRYSQLSVEGNLNTLWNSFKTFVHGSRTDLIQLNGGESKVDVTFLTD